MKPSHAIIVSLALAAYNANAVGFTNLVGFVEETKIKGGFTEVQGLLYFACEKGGSNNFGYLGRFDPVQNSVTPLYHFGVDTKPKGGLARLGDDLLFMAEKGSPTTTWGWIGRFNLASKTVAQEFAYATDLKPKSGFVNAGGALYYATEKGGAANLGMIEKFTPGAGVTTVADLTLTLGVKIESWAYDPGANVVYFGAREGGDTSQLAGKGAGSLGRIDVTTGAITNLVSFQNENHGAKLRGLDFHAGKLSFVLEEGGDLTLNSGKGGGAIVSFDLASGTLTRLHRFDHTTGSKPKGLVRAGDDLYFATEAGGTGALGVFGMLRDGSRFEVLTEFDATFGAKPDPYLVAIGSRIYLTPELGMSGYLGGILAYESAASAEDQPPSLAIVPMGNKLRIRWPASATGYTLVRAAVSSGAEWEPAVGTSGSEGGEQFLEVDFAVGTGFFRLRK